MCFPPHPPVFGPPILFTYRGSAALSRFHGNVLWMDGKSVWLFDGAAASCVVLPWGRAAARHHKREKKKERGKRKVKAFLLLAAVSNCFIFFLFFYCFIVLFPIAGEKKRRWSCGEWCENLEWFHTNARTHQLKALNGKVVLQMSVIAFMPTPTCHQQKAVNQLKSGAV